MIRVPDFPIPGLTTWLTELLKDRERITNDLLSKVTANHSVLLQTPLGKVFEVTVDEAGVLKTTRVA